MAGRLRFDSFEVDVAARRLLRHGARVRLRHQSFEILLAFLERPGEVVTREDLRLRLWSGDVFVNFEDSLNTAVARLREALGDSADQPRYIETLSRIGYRFLAGVSESHAPTASARPAKARLMVLPFVNSSGDPSQEYFSDAVTDEIITELSALAPGDLGVIARTTAMHYKATDKDVAKIARELSLDWVVEGSARRSEDQVFVTAQLIRTTDQTHVFGRRYEVKLPDMFRLEQSVALELGRIIGIVHEADPSAAYRRTVRRPTEDLVAYNDYIQGRHHFERATSAQSWARARECFERATARDPRFALAHDALAELWWHTGFFAMMRPKDALMVGLPHAEKAVEIDGQLAEAHAMLAQFRKQLDFDWDKVQQEMNRALELNPFSPVVRMRRAVAGLMPFGRLDEAVADLEMATELDPIALFPRLWLAFMYSLDRRFDRALEEAHLLLELEPPFAAQLVIGLVCREARRFSEALTALCKARDLSGGAPMILGWLGLALAESGNEAGARSLLDGLKATPPDVYVPPTSFAWIHLGLGEIEQAYTWMERAIEDRDPIIVPIKSYPFLDPLRNEVRFHGLLRKMNMDA